MNRATTRKHAWCFQLLLIAALLPLCWLWMMVVHEAGHVLGGWLTGGTVQRVVLHPLAFSRTDVLPNPHPLAVAWAGPIVGVALPAVLLAAWRFASCPDVHLFRFFAGFCMIANGAYIGVGSLARIGDAGDMLATGSPIWTLWLFGLLTFPCGLYLWNGLGPRFGIGKDARAVDSRSAYTVFGFLLVTLLLEFLLSAK